MFKRLFYLITTTLALSLVLGSCASRPSPVDTVPQGSESKKEDMQTILGHNTVPLAPSEDMGERYIDSFVFLGESTTYHLKSRGVLSGGTATTQVWGPKSGTLMLDETTCACRIVYPESGEELDIDEAMRRRCPEYILLTFGLNGATRSISLGADYFKSCYRRLIDTLRSASPSTVIILQSCFPVASNMDMSGYSVDLPTLNRYIDQLNVWTAELASEYGLGYLNTAEILKDPDGALRIEYQAGDGYHLTANAYREILKYIRTHGYKGDNTYE